VVWAAVGNVETASQIIVRIVTIIPIKLDTLLEQEFPAIALVITCI
jgi:hypothetical protein